MRPTMSIVKAAVIPVSGLITFHFYYKRPEIRIDSPKIPTLCYDTPELQFQTAIAINLMRIRRRTGRINY